jgi:hypothetical protein
MKRAPYTLALFAIAITIYRSAIFGAEGLQQGWLGWSAAILVACGVYVGFYFLRTKKTKWPGIVIGGFSALIDLWVNIFEIIRVLSVTELVAGNANFIGYDATDIRTGMQYTALAFGAFPTILAALLGWLQGAVDQEPAFNKAGAFSRLISAIFGIFGNFVAAMAFRVEFMAGIGHNAEGAEMLPGNAPGMPVKVTRRGWYTLSADEVATIPTMSREVMMAVFGISNGTAGDWKRRVLSGERPWKQLP